MTNLKPFQPTPDADTVLITGVAGYIGGQTALAFHDAGWRVIGVDNLSVGTRDTVPECVEFIHADCRDPDLAARIAPFNPVAAVHFAGLIRVDESVRKPVDYYDVNFCAAGAFFRTVQALGIEALVFSSTAAVYGDGLNGPITEDTPLSPASPYGRSKLATEWMLRDFCTSSGARAVILRYFNVAGADPQGRRGPRRDATHLIKRVAEAAVDPSRTMMIFGNDYDTPDGTCVRDFIHVADLAQAHVAAVAYLLNGGDSVTLNCGYGTGFSVHQVIARAAAIIGRKFDIRIAPRRAGDPVFVVANPGLLQKTLNWVPQYNDLDKILRAAIKWEWRMTRPVQMPAPRTNDKVDHGTAPCDPQPDIRM